MAKNSVGRDTCFLKSALNGLLFSLWAKQPMFVDLTEEKLATSLNNL